MECISAKACIGLKHLDIYLIQKDLGAELEIWHLTRFQRGLYSGAYIRKEICVSEQGAYIRGLIFSRACILGILLYWKSQCVIQSKSMYLVLPLFCNSLPQHVYFKMKLDRNDDTIQIRHLMNDAKLYTNAKTNVHEVYDRSIINSEKTNHRFYLFAQNK